MEVVQPSPNDRQSTALLKPPLGDISWGQLAVLVLAVFLKGGLLGAYVPFSSLWISLKGHSARHLGLVALVDTVSSLLLPFIGGAVDKLRAHNTGFVLILVLLTGLKLAYLPCGGSLPAILALTACTAPLLRASNSVLDALALYAFAERGQFPRVRLVGDLGYGCMALGVGIAMDYFRTEDAIFYVFAAICATLALIWAVASPYMRNIRPDSKQMSNAEFSAQVQQLATEAMNADSSRALLVLVLLGGVGGLISTYEFVLIKEMGGSGLLLGLCKLTGTIAAIPVWWNISAAMDKIGFRNIQLVGLVGGTLRLLILGFVTRPTHVLLSEALSGIGGFALSYSSITVLAGRVMNEDLKGTAQTIIFVIYVGVGGGGSPFLGSFVVESLGIQGMFICTSVVYGLVLAGLIAFDFLDCFVWGTYRRFEEACRPMSPA